MGNFLFSFLKKRHHTIIAIIVALLTFGWYAFNFFWGERVWYNNGAGWDGLLYVNLTQDFHEVLKAQTTSTYRLTHSLPFLILHYLWRLFGEKFDGTPEVVNAMLVFNYIMVAIAAFYTHRICKFYSFSNQTRFIVYAALFFTVPLLKKFMYIPVGTDVTAFAIGIASFYYFIKRNYLTLFIATLLGGFTYPSIGYAGLILIAVSPDIQIADRQFERVNHITRFIFLILFSLGLYWVLNTGFQSKSGSQQLNSSLLIISIIAILFYVYFMLKPVQFGIRFPHNFIRKVLPFLLVGGLFMVMYTTIPDYFSSPAYNALTLASLFKAIFYGSITNPLAPLVCHISYYGPFILLIVIFWRKIYHEVEKFGLPMVLFIGLYLFLSLGRESRQFINAWPVFVFIAAIYIDKLKLSWRFTYIFVLLSLIFSKVWFTINVPDMTMKGGLQSFPAQRFFMMNGAWMSTNMYYAHLAASVLAFILIFLVLRNEQQKVVSLPKFVFLRKKNR